MSAGPQLRLVPEDNLIDRLTNATSLLARRNEALEDYAALVAHELKTPLNAALVADDPARSVEQALALVDDLLAAARAESADGGVSSLTDVLDSVLDDLDLDGVRVTASSPGWFPLPACTLRVILRNLVRNAVAAGARTIHVWADRAAPGWTLVVEDDGVGLADASHYRSGSGLGLMLSRRVAARFGGEIELTAGPVGGTRALVVLEAAA